MDCKQVLFLLQHSEDFQKINSKEKTALQEHLQHCLSCRHEYELTQKLEGLLQQLYHYPLLPQLSIPASLGAPRPRKPRTLQILVPLFALALLIAFLAHRSLQNTSTYPSVSLASLPALPEEPNPPTQVQIQSSALWVPQSLTPLNLALKKGFSKAPDTQVSAFLVSQDQQKYPLFERLLVTEGSLQQSVKVPELPQGSYQLQIRTVSAQGEVEKTYQETVQVRPLLRLLLQTDKPRYQRNQSIYFHSVLSSPSQNEAFPQKTIVFQIYDPQGNLLFLTERKTNPSSSTWGYFKLADEISDGTYRIRAYCKEAPFATMEKTVEVLRYQLPKMRIKTEFPRKYYTPHEKPSFKIKVLYPYGSPVSQAKVQIQVIDENHKNYLQGNSELQTNAQGECEGTFSFLSLDSPLENPLSLYFITRVEDTAEQVVHHSTPLFLSENNFQLQVLPQGGTLVPGLSNTIFCVLTTPEGAPVEEASIQFRDENSVYPLPLKQGVGEFSLTPKKSNFNPTSYLLSYTLNLPSQKPLEGEIQLPLEKKAEHLLLALDKGIYQPGEDFEVTLHSTEKNTPIFLQWLQEGVLVLQGQAEPHFEGKRVWKGTLPLQISGTLVLKASQISAHGKWISTQRLAFIRPPEAHFQINVHSERHYFPTDTVPLSFSSHRRDQTPVSGSIAVSIVDEMVFALPSQNLAQLFYELEEQRRKSSVRSLALDPNAVRESLKTQVLEEAQQITAKAYYATQESTENSLDFGDLSHTHLISDPDQAKQILAAHLPEYLLDHSFLIEKNGKAEVDSQLFTRLIFKKNLPLDPFLQGRAFTIEEILPHLQTNPFRHCTQVSDLIRSTEEYRRQKLVQEFGKRNSHDEIIKKLQAQNKSTARAFTPLGIAIDLKAEAEEKLRSGFSWVAKEEAPSHEITEPEHTLIPPQLNQQAEGSPLKEKEADKKVLLPASSSTSSPPETQIDELEPPSGSEEEDSDPSTKALNEQKNSLWEKEIRTEEESSFSEAPISLEEEFEEEEEEEEPGTFQDSIKDNDAREEQKKRDVLIDENKRGKGGKGDEIGGSNKDRKGGRQEQKAEKEKGDDKHKLLFPIPRGLQLRRFFPETLYFNGEIPLVEGKAKFEVRAPDSITEFRVQATLSSTEGALGFQQKSFKVYRPFFIDFNLPTTLTVGDTLHLPIVVHNGVEKNLFLKFHLKKQDWFEVISEESFKEENGFIVMDDEMKAKKVQTWVVPLRIVKAGKHLLKLVVHCPEEDLQSLKNLNLEERDLQDALEREIEIFPQGKKQTYSQNFLLSPSQEQNLRWSAPPEAIEEAQQRFLKVYPNLLSLLREEVLLENRTFGGLEQILNMGLPLVLLYRKIKETRPLTEEQELHLNALAQRILSYQNTEGFSAFRKGESDPVLTLFATYFLYHIEKLQSWKAEEEQEALSYRHKIFVLDSLSKSFSGFSPKEALKPLRQNPILYGSLAYLLLQEMGVSPQESTMIHIRQKLDKFSDIPSLPLRAFIAYALKEEEFFQDLFTFENLTLSEQLQLHALRLQSGCPQGKLMQQEDITFLLQHKKAEGYWEELLTNFVAMQALLQTSLPASPEKKGLEVTLNKERLDLQAGIIELIPLSSQESSWTLISNQPLFCQFVARYYTPWKLKEESASASPLKVSYEAVQKVKRERWFAKVEFTPEKGQIQTPLLLEIGIPPGFSVENTDSLLHKYPQWIQAIEPTETHVLVYLKPQEDLKETLKFDIRLQALLRLKVQAPVSAFRELTFHGKTGESGFLEAIDTSDSSSK